MTCPESSGMGEATVSGTLLRDKDVNLHAIAVSPEHLWCGCATSPSRLVRMPHDFSEYEVFTLEPAGGLHDLAWDGTWLWVAHASGHLSRLSPADDSLETVSLTLPSRQRAFAYACRSHDHELWIAMYTEPGSLLRIDKTSLELTQYELPEAPMWSVRDLAFCQGWVWACVYDMPGRIVGLDPITGRRTTFTLSEEHALPSTILATNEHLWVGLDTIPARVLKIDPNVGVLRSFVFEATAASVRALALSDTDLWIALHTEPAKLIQLNLVCERWQSMRLPPHYQNSRSLACGEQALFIGLQNRRHDPSAVCKLPLPAATPRPWQDTPPARLTAQDWYRVRRGEDQLAWGMEARLEGLPSIVLSRRAGEELCFLSESERAACISVLRDVWNDNTTAPVAPVEASSCWLIATAGELRIVLRHTGLNAVEVATIRKREGQAFDPEHIGRPNPVPGLQWRQPQ